MRRGGALDIMNGGDLFVKMHPDLVALLVCPACKGKLVDEGESAYLLCTSCGRQYPIVRGIPILLNDAAGTPVVPSGTVSEERR
jgi:uncharacterized protein YbaR (Trm112 family)